MAQNGMAAPLRRNKAVLSKLADEAKTQFLVSARAMPTDGFKDVDAMTICKVSLPRPTKPGPDIERAEADEAEEQEYIEKTIASIPIEDPEMVYSHLFQVNACYQAMAPNNKVIIFTDDMNVKKAFYALVYNSVRTGLVADTKTYTINGVLSATDFIMVLMKLWRFREAIRNVKGDGLSQEEVERTDITNMPISNWREQLKKDGRFKKFQTTDAQESLYAATARLAESRIHRLPVFNDGECMFIITHRRLLHFIWAHAALLPKPEFLRERVRDLGVGTWGDVKYVTDDTPLIETLDVLINNGFSGVPVVEEDTLRVTNVYSRFDAISVAFGDAVIDFSISTKEAIQRHKNLTEKVGGVVTVNEGISMWNLLETFVQMNVYRVFAVDHNLRLKGLISLSDVINFMVLRPRCVDV